jgi:hypothetical protein
VPLTRGPGGAALQFEVELASLDQFDRFRERGMQSEQDTGSWMRAMSQLSDVTGRSHTSYLSPIRGSPIVIQSAGGRLHRSTPDNGKKTVSLTFFIEFAMQKSAMVHSDHRDWDD